MPPSSSSWRAALPRVRVSETSDLPTAQLAALLASGGERVAALEAYREVLVDAPDDLQTLHALTPILARLGREAEENEVRGRIAVLVVAGMNLAPEHRGAALAFELALTGLGPVPAEMPAGYVAALFDAFAAGFDASLRDDLRYRAPELLHQALTRALAATNSGAGLDVCDVGCGTGLLGVLLRPLARRLDGIDRSSRMLDHARLTGVYDDLVEADLTAALGDRPDVYDVVTAADVFVYIGDLAPALGAAARALHRGGLAAFTVETTDEAYCLQPSGRYQHAPDFVRDVASTAGFTEVSADEVVLRVERALPVVGTVWLWRKN